MRKILIGGAWPYANGSLHIIATRNCGQVFRKIYEVTQGLWLWVILL